MSSLFKKNKRNKEGSSSVGHKCPAFIKIKIWDFGFCVTNSLQCKSNLAFRTLLQTTAVDISLFLALCRLRVRIHTSLPAKQTGFTHRQRWSQTLTAPLITCPLYPVSQGSSPPFTAIENPHQVCVFSSHCCAAWRRGPSRGRTFLWS